jgi:hypothetical protein
MEMARWAVKHEGARGSPALVELVRANKFPTEVRRRWEDPELGPLLPPTRRP